MRNDIRRTPGRTPLAPPVRRSGSGQADDSPPAYEDIN